MLLFHGTTVENAREILKSGFAYNKQNWNCSLEETYFFNGDYFAGEDELESREELISYGVRVALQQSFISLAIENPIDYRGAVLVFDTDLMNNGNDIRPDESCDNMEMAVALRNPDMQGLVGYFEMNEAQNALRFYTLAQFTNNDYIMEVDLSRSEQIFVNAIAGNSDMMCELAEVSSEVEYSEVDFNQYTTRLQLVA